MENPIRQVGRVRVIPSRVKRSTGEESTAKFSVEDEGEGDPQGTDSEEEQPAAGLEDGDRRIGAAPDDEEGHRVDVTA